MMRYRMRWAAVTAAFGLALVGAGTGVPEMGRDYGPAGATSQDAGPAFPAAWAAAPPSGKAYITGTTSLLKSPSGPAVGSLTPGTPVTIIETQGADSHVSLVGYSSGGSNTVVSAVGVRITLATISAPDQVQRQAGAQTKDAYGTAWTQVTVSGWLASSALTTDVESVWTHGRQIYEAHCSNCHSLYAPDAYTANQWPGNLQAMASNGGLAGEDFALVLKYLQTHAKAQ